VGGSVVSKRVKIAILGGSGYTALELILILLRHPYAEIVAITSREPQSIASFHPALLGRLNLVCQPFDPLALRELGVELVFSCLPHGASAEAVKPCLEQGFKVIDLSADYRIKDASVYASWYGHPVPDAANLSHAVYGLPELNREKIRQARLIANPGCYPQSAILAMAPLARRIWIRYRGAAVTSVSGISGAGRTPKLATLFPECNENVMAYSIGNHRHTPEIDAALDAVSGQSYSVIFTPHLVPMDRGIHTTVVVGVSRKFSAAQLQEALEEDYRGEPFVRIRSEPPGTKAVAHTNYCDIHAQLVRDHVVVTSVLDNLVRGASGVAVQNMNILFGFPETTGF